MAPLATDQSASLGFSSPGLNILPSFLINPPPGFAGVVPTDFQPDRSFPLNRARVPIGFSLILRKSAAAPLFRASAIKPALLFPSDPSPATRPSIFTDILSAFSSASRVCHWLDASLPSALNTFTMLPAGGFEPESPKRSSYPVSCGLPSAAMRRKTAASASDGPRKSSLRV